MRIKNNSTRIRFRNMLKRDLKDLLKRAKVQREEKKSIVPVRMCESLKRTLKIQSAKEGISMSELITKLILDYVAKNP